MSTVRMKGIFNHLYTIRRQDRIAAILNRVANWKQQKGIPPAISNYFCVKRNRYEMDEKAKLLSKYLTTTRYTRILLLPIKRIRRPCKINITITCFSINRNCEINKIFDVKRWTIYTPRKNSTTAYVTIQRGRTTGQHRKNFARVWKR